MNETITFNILKETDEVLVFTVNAIEIQICVKLFSAILPANIKEIEIHKKLNDIAQHDNRIKNKILKIHGYEFFTLSHRLSTIFKLDISHTHKIQVSRYIKKAIDKLFDYELDMIEDGSDCELLYFITEYNDKYVTMDKNKELFKSHYDTNPTDLCILLENLFVTLIYLNKMYDFVHWDLHDGNLLVNKDNFTEFLLLDFNFSEMVGDANDTIIEACEDDYGVHINDIINMIQSPHKMYNKRKFYGLANDIAKIFVNIEMYLSIESNIKVNNFKSEIIKQIIKHLIDIQYIDCVDFYEKITPSLCLKLMNIIEH